MKGNIKKLTAFVIVVAIAMFTVVAMASADDRYRHAIQGQYAFTGFGQCLAAPFGFTSLIPNIPPPGVPAPRWVIDTSSWEGIYTFYHNGTGVMRAINRFIEILPGEFHNPLDPPIPPSGGSLIASWEFNYTVEDSGRIIFKSGPGAWSVKYCSGTNAGGQASMNSPAPVRGVISPDGQTINVTLGPPDQILSAPSEPTQLLCTVSNVLFKQYGQAGVHDYTECPAE